MVDLRDHEQDLVSAELTIVVIGPASAEQARAFAGTMEIPFAIYVDPTGDAFRVYGLQETSMRRLTNPRVVARGISAQLRNFPPGRPKGNPKQLPGTALIDQQGRLRLHHVASYASDHLSSRQLIDAAATIHSSGEADLHSRM